MFQFLTVRLKYIVRITPDGSVLFQFLTVRLKSRRSTSTAAATAVSIPYSTIKMPYGRVMGQLFRTAFQFLTVRLKLL